MHALRLLALLVVSGGLVAAADHAESLADRSPFLPRGNSGTSGVATSEDTLELRGVMSGSDGYLFYVYDPAKKRGAWAGSNDAEGPFTIVASDAKRGNLEIRMTDGRLLLLKLRDAKTLADAMNPNGAPKANSVADAGPSPRNLNEVQAAWREEFNRRVAENSANQ